MIFYILNSSKLNYIICVLGSLMSALSCHGLFRERTPCTAVTGQGKRQNRGSVELTWGELGNEAITYHLGKNRVNMITCKSSAANLCKLPKFLKTDYFY